MPTEHRNYCNGEWVASESGETFTVTNPAAETDVVGRLPYSTESDTEWAIDAAADAQEEWANTSGPERGRILRDAGVIAGDRKDELVETLVREEGKTRSEAAGEVQRAIDILFYYAEKARDHGGTSKPASASDRQIQTKKEPLGVAGLITPWNYPIAIPAWKLAPALATGNTVVLKPASQAPISAKKLVECLDDAGLPPGVLNFVTGSGSTIGSTLVSHDAVDAISFTGSSKTGDVVYQEAAEDQKRVQLEMGGKNPTVVMPSADVDDAVDIVGAGAFGVTGQACTAASRAIVHEDVADEFLDGVVEYAESLDIGPGLEDPDMGPHVSESELEVTLDYVDVADDDGATLETGGDALSDGEYDSGHYVEPTVFSDVDTEMRIAQEEVFGPLLSVIEVSDFEEALDVANDTEYGLSASIVSENADEIGAFVDGVESGVVKVNEKTTGLELHVPFGGMKDSSNELYREQGDAGVDFFTTTKTVYSNY
ncbi:2,5-dioxovalerate dehydrogenase [Haloarcula salina]|uniref:Aldehyde dehydrogenase family protein n=1 Tax=Haloarcula salina TaxID=1429914 RepID=A0AA41KGV8_9EURY|nr:aldehyde dehydrogenase family protein [Haloarcula salina]MBV0903537.1 aldehyde dehydrogenase family protein [Haloarcula salina]